MEISQIELEIMLLLQENSWWYKGGYANISHSDLLSNIEWHYNRTLTEAELKKHIAQLSQMGLIVHYTTEGKSCFILAPDEVWVPAKENIGDVC